MAMGFSTVYRCLEELFPQIDPRLLKAVAYEHRKDADAAVEVVLSEILPSMPETTKLPSESLGSKSYSDDEGHDEEESLSLRRHRAAERMQESHVGSKSALPYSNDIVGHVGSSNSPAPFIDMEAFWDENDASNDTSTFGDPFTLKGAEETVVHLERTSEDQSKTSGPLDGAAVFDEVNANNADSEELILLGSTGKTEGNTDKLLIDLNEKAYVESGSTIIDNGSRSTDYDNSFLTYNIQQKSNTSPEIGMNLVYQQPPLVQEDPMQTLYEEANHNLVEAHATPITENTQQEASSREDVTYHHDDNADVAHIMMSPENEIATDTNLTRSAQISEVHLLDQTIDDAKNNKRALFSALESVMDTMKEVEAQEIAAEKAKEEAAVAGLDIYSKVDELHKTLARAKEANDMHAGEVYGERAILATEVRELQSRLLCLSDERDLSLTILDEMRAGLESRLAAAEKLRQDSEHEKHEKEGLARHALMEQEALMEKVVQESKRLQEEAQENNKLREFLMDRGSIVDTLQGEITVICQDVKQLKEKFDSGVSLSKSISSSQTTCILASSSSSIESFGSVKTPEKPSPSQSVNSSPRRNFEEVANAGMVQKELVVEEGWELCGDDDMEY